VPYLGRSPGYGLAREKSAEVVVGSSNEPSPNGIKTEVSQLAKGPNVKFVPNAARRLSQPGLKRDSDYNQVVR
jgi:hypothetical protein